jgi:SMC interacting uncharacterized protein involved in chromosome segregation
MKVRRNLSGIYFRSKNEKTEEWTNVVFEDLSLEEQDRVMKNREIQWLKSLIDKLFETYSGIIKYILDSEFEDVSDEELNKLSNSLLMVKNEIDKLDDDINTLKRVAKHIANKLNNISSQFDIYAGTPDNS